MADIKISQLGAAIAVGDTDLLPIVSGGNTLKATAAQVKEHSIGNTNISSIGDGSVTGAINALNTDKQPKTLDTPLTIGGVSKTTVEAALGGLVSENQTLTKKFYNSVSDMMSASDNFQDGDIIGIMNGGFFKVTSSSNAITKTLNNGKYAELLPDADGFYHIGALALSNWADIYPILSYLFTNEKYLIFIENGNYTMSDTLLLDVATTPQIQIVGESKTKTFIKCTKGFLKVNVVGGGFRASVIKNLHLEGTATGAVGGDYYGIQIQWKTTDANNMIDYLNISDLMMQYFNIALLLSGRVIWNNFTNLTLRYNKIAFQFSNNDSAAFFNNNVFINCEFDANLNYGIVLAGKEGQAVSNVFVGCSIEGNNYGDTTSGNLTEMVITRCSAKFESCHFEKVSGVTNFVAVVPTKSCVSFDGCMFLNYSGHMLTNTESTAIFEACTIYNCSQTVYGTDTGTTVFSHSHVIT